MSDMPLVTKLGFVAGDSIFVMETPDWYSDFVDENGLDLTPGLPATHAHIFFETRKELVDFLKQNDLKDIEKSLWVSWHKQAAGIKTDVTEQLFRDSILPLGWVDTKVVAIDDQWSGLKFVRRKG